MRYLCHRGYWNEAIPQNSLVSFVAAFERGLGVETDVRDLDGELVISHDPPRSGAIRFDELLETWSSIPGAGVMALNIKADGLAKMLREKLTNVDPARYFFFDMSLPDTLHYIREGLPIFARHSEYERDIAFLQNARGVWMDCFESNELISPVELRSVADMGKEVAIVSPELHKRSQEAYWSELNASELWKSDRVLLCTDFPDQATKVFMND